MPLSAAHRSSRKDTARLRGELDALHRTAVALSTPLDSDALLELIVEQAANLVEGSFGYVYVLSEDGVRMVERVAQGPFLPFLGTEITKDQGVAGVVWRTRTAHVENAYRSLPSRRDLGDSTPHAVLGAPLFVGGAIVGVLGLGKMLPGSAFSDDDLLIVERFAQLASLAIERVRLHADLRRELQQRRATEEELLHTVGRLSSSELALKRSHEEMVRRLATAAEERDGATGRHIERMSATCERIARHLGLDDAFCESIRIASPLHDVGKIGIPDRVLLKPGKLDDDERAAIERHAEIGYRMLRGAGSDLLDLAASIALTHHERFDGAGYPQGLRGEEIPLEGRIAAVADVFDALTTDRVYRPAFPFDEAMAMLVDGRGTQFDPAVLDAFVAVVGGSKLRPERVALAIAERPDPRDPEPGAPVNGTLAEETLAGAAGDAARSLAHVTAGREGIDDALKRLCRGAGSGVLASVYVLEHDRMWCVAQCGYDQVRDGFTLSQGVMGRALRSNSAEFLEEVRDDPGYIAALPGIVSELAIPLVGERVHAILNIETVGVRLPHCAVEAVAPLVESMLVFVDTLSASLQLDLATLARLTVYASSLRSVGALSEFSTRTLGRLLDLEAAQLTLGGAASDAAASFWRRPESTLVPMGSETIAAVSALSSLSDYTWSVLDAADINVAKPDDPGRWLLWLPLRVRGAQIGTLVGRSNTPITLEHEQVEAAILFAQQLAALIDAGQALQREQRAAVTDSLTGLLNRRGFDERLHEEIGRAERSGRPLTVVLTDCDDLKHVNDRFGRDGGDALLQGLARVLRHGKRVSDVAGRVGGDEFGLLLPEADAAVAAAVVERLRVSIHELRSGGSHTTASFGIAVFPDDGTTGTALLRVAGQALYEAKHQGKDRLAGAIAFS